MDTTKRRAVHSAAPTVFADFVDRSPDMMGILSTLSTVMTHGAKSLSASVRGEHKKV